MMVMVGFGALDPLQLADPWVGASKMASPLTTRGSSAHVRAGALVLHAGGGRRARCRRFPYWSACFVGLTRVGTNAVR